MYTTILSMPFFRGGGPGERARDKRGLLGIVSVQSAFLAPISGRISDSVGRATRPAGSLFVVAGAVALLFGISEDVGFWYLPASLGALGLGLGISMSPTGAAAIESSPRELAGAAAAPTR